MLPCYQWMRSPRLLLLQASGCSAASAMEPSRSVKRETCVTAATNHCYYWCLWKETLLFCRPLPCNPAAEAALQPVIWRSEGSCSQVSSSPEECFSTDTGMTFAITMTITVTTIVAITNTILVRIYIYIYIYTYTYIQTCSYIHRLSQIGTVCDTVCVYVYMWYVYIYVYI